MSRILFVHNNFPGRFDFLLSPLRAAGHELAAIADGGRRVDGIPLLLCRGERSSTPGIFNLALRTEADFIRGKNAADRALQLKQGGFEPDLIIGHPAWGQTVFMKEVFPNARQILVSEFFYRSQGADVGFDPEFGALGTVAPFQVHAKNAALALALTDADRIICPTQFQASVLPPAFRDRSVVIHEGIDTDRVKPVSGASLRLRDEIVLDGSTPVITFINRVFEPTRGFHIMMRALPAFLEAVPTAHVLMIGKYEKGGYGAAAPDGSSWASVLVKELGHRLDPKRVIFTGAVPYDTMLSALSISWAHVYYTYPFVLSWSALEAMACECLMLGSDTPPVRDVIEHGKNGVLNDFFDVGALSRSMIEACQSPTRFRAIREAARRTVIDRFDRHQVCLPQWLGTIDGVLSGSRSSQAEGRS